MTTNTQIAGALNGSRTFLTEPPEGQMIVGSTTLRRPTNKFNSGYTTVQKPVYAPIPDQTPLEEEEAAPEQQVSPDPEPDLNRIKDATERAAAFKKGYEMASAPGLKTGGSYAGGSGASDYNPYAAGAKFMKDANDRFSALTNWTYGDAIQQTAEIGAANDAHLARIQFDAPSIKDPSTYWKDYLNA